MPRTLRSKTRSNSDWSTSGIPDYLKLRVQVETAAGATLCSGRNLTTVRQSIKTKVKSSFKTEGLNAIPAWRQAVARMERTHLESWDFEDLPESIDLTNTAELPLKAFPGLVLDDDNIVHLRLLRDKASALAVTQKGFPALCEIAMSRDIAWLLRDLKAIKQLGTLLLPLGNPETVRRNAWQQIRGHLFRCKSLLPLRRAEFEKTLSRAKEEARTIIPMFLDRFQALLEARQRVSLLLERKKTSNAITYPGMRTQMESIAPPELLEQYTFEEMPDLTRFLKAMYLRAERAKENVRRDMEKSKRIEPFEQKLIKLRQSAQTPQQIEQIKHYKMMLEEFKVSIFAQELGTAHKVSEKRLEQLAQGLIR